MLSRKMWLLIISMVTALILVGCGDSDSTNVVTPPPNTITITVSLDSPQVIDGGAPTGSASATLTINVDDNTLDGTVTLNNITADGVTISQGFAGEVGEMLFNFEQSNATTWLLPANVLTTEVMAMINSGELYLKVSNATDGALRGQIITGGIQLIFTTLSGSQEVPIVTTTGSAKGAITLDPASGAIVIHLNASGLDDAVASHLHQALAGLNGDVVIGLTQDAAALGHWSATGNNLENTQMATLDKGEFYLNLHTPTELGGEVRGQVEPEGVEVVFTTLSGEDEVPPVITSNSGIAATTIVTSSVDIHVNLQGLDDATSVTVNQAPARQNGQKAYDFIQDVNNLSHWSLDNTELTADQSAALFNQGLYLNVASPLNPGGELRGQLIPAVSTPVVAVTLSQLKTEIFTPTCAVVGCHTGAAPAQGMNLSADQIFSNIVGVASMEVSSLNRVEPGDPDNSYLVRKIEGTAIVGGRMPLFRTPLSNAEIQMIRNWISDGAKDN